MSPVSVDARAVESLQRGFRGEVLEANEESASDDENVAWARDTVAAPEPFGSGGGYLNFPGLFEEGEEQLRASYGEQNYNRLVAVKNRVDPENLFGSACAIRATV